MEIATQKPKRFQFIDVLRGLSVLWMIEAHLTDVILDTNFKKTGFFHYIDISNGFVAVIFLFCAGASFYISSSRKFDDYKHFRKPLWRYLQRLVFILVIAFALNLPRLSIWLFTNASYNELIKLFECNILHTIVYSSVFALLIFLIIPKLKYLKYISLIIALVIYFATSYVWSLDPFQSMNLFFAPMFAEWPVSHFPLFPWMGHFFVGIAITSFFMEASDKIAISKKLGIISLILILITLLAKNLNLYNYPYVQNWWDTDPGHFIFRASVTILLFSILYLTEHIYSDKWYSKPLVLMGQESLFYYVGNVILIYGSVANIGFRQIFHSSASPISTLIIYIVFTIGLYYIGVLWHKTKDEKPDLSKKIMYSTGVLLLTIMIFN
ncbi:MAG TPA: heparan-alpha-glucosaminide N-acetyltransferase domain-containing protein [Candidatus Kapabacteria bacterium]|nr:heparan-alpha-glucosaminide N-acetyltransferase domain-containing protein [Candidatus Kapabacteria bacterium]